MIQFRQPDVNVGYIIMCQIFIAFAGGTLVITEQIAVMAATTHQYVAVVLAVQYMFSSIGGAIGQTDDRRIEARRGPDTPSARSPGRPDRPIPVVVGRTRPVWTPASACDPGPAPTTATFEDLP